VPRVSAFHGIVIEMWFDEHPPPHFHARYAEYEASIAIDNLTVVDGALPPRILRKVREWAFQHRPTLLANWYSARSYGVLTMIEPLR
jgi:uncharacterized protein DUF4160